MPGKTLLGFNSNPGIYSVDIANPVELDVLMGFAVDNVPAPLRVQHVVPSVAGRPNRLESLLDIADQEWPFELVTLS